MTKGLSPFQGYIIVFISFSFFRACDATTAFSNIDLSTTALDPDTTGFIIKGNGANDYFGNGVNTAGDLDNDGYDDILIAASSSDSNRGAVYVVYGGEKSSMSNIDLSTQILDPLTTGFKITGTAANNGFGASVSTAGDINNDGFSDIIVGEIGRDSYRGAVYVIYGGPKSSMTNIALSTTVLDPSTTGFTITGSASGDNLGYFVSAAGDINNDGYDDIIIGAPYFNTNRGAAYVIYGGEKSSMVNIILSSQTLDPLTSGFMITGSAAGDLLGRSVSSAGDVNNDGHDDIIIGAAYKNSNRGAAYVIYGGEKSSMTNIYLSTQTLDPLTTGFMIIGNAMGDFFGISVSTAGDLNNDGYDDIIVGAFMKNSERGAAYVIYGGEKSSMTNINLSTQTLDPLTTGFMITGNAAGDFFGNWVSTAGDLHNDGYDDIIVGAFEKNSNRGAVYVIYGREKSSMSNIALSTQTLDPLVTGFIITGSAAGNHFGGSVSIAGDTNKDGYSEIIVGAYAKGAAYLISPAQCLTNCNQCSSFSQCTECKTLYSFYQSKCVASCPNTTFSSTGVCQYCSANCNQCTSSSLCVECISPFVLYEAQCLASCPSAFFNSANKCKSCSSYCSSCISQDSCLVCFQGYTLLNSLCVLSSQGTQEEASQAISSATKGIGSVVCVGSAVFPLSALVSKIVQNTRYLNLSVTSDLAEIYQTWGTDMISWGVPNVMEDLDHFETSSPLFAQYDIGSPFFVNFWPTLMNIGISLTIFVICIVFQKLFDNAKYEGWAYSLVQKLVAGSFNFAFVQAYACLDDILFYLVLDIKTNPFDSFFSWTSLICAFIFLAGGCLLIFFNFWTVNKYQSIKHQGTKDIEAFNERNKYWELFYSDFSDDDLWSQSFFATLIIRSGLSSFIITMLYDYPLMQTSFLVILDGAIILFLYFKSPFNTLQGKLAQYYYEIITLLVHLCTFVLSFQDSFHSSSDNVTLIMSTGIIYLNTALISGTIGFMFIEIFEKIRLEMKARKIKQRQSVPKDNQETQNLTQLPLQPSEASALKRPSYTTKKFNFAPENINNLAHSDFIHREDSQIRESSFNANNSISLEMGPSHRFNHQRKQVTRKIIVRPQPQTLNQNTAKKQLTIPNSLRYIWEFSNN